MNIEKFQKGILKLEVRVKNPEKFLNLLWKNNININNIYRENITTLIMKIKLSDYRKIENIAQKTNAKIRVIKREGISFWVIKLRKRSALTMGTLIFLFLLYYFSTYIWNISIVSDKYTAPFEIRQQLKNIGIKPGINKRKLNLNEIKEKIMNSNDSIMWMNLIIQGSNLKVTYVERKTPPNIVHDDTPCDIVALKDAIIERIYTTSGTAVVKPGDIVKKGQLLVKGEQGSGDNSYKVPAKGEIIGKTFYEQSENVSTTATIKTKTENKINYWYIKIGSKKIYLKKSLNKYKNYDRIVNSYLFINKETIYETKKNVVKVNAKNIIDETSQRLYLKITDDIEKTNTISDKKVEFDIKENIIFVRVLVTAEESIGSIQRG